MVEQGYTIGFANFDERNSFAVSLREGLEAAAAKHSNVTLITRDNALELARAKANVLVFIARHHAWIGVEAW